MFATRKLLLTLGDRLMVGLQILALAIGVRIPVSQPLLFYSFREFILKQVRPQNGPLARN